MAARGDGKIGRVVSGLVGRAVAVGRAGRLRALLEAGIVPDLSGGSSAGAATPRASRRAAPAAPMRPQSRHTLELLAICAASLVPWTILLAVTLPENREVHQWRAAWVGFDSILITAMAATVVLGWRRHRAVFLTGPATAVLLICDAWFDISFDVGTSDVWVSAALAGFAELPLAAFLIQRCYRLLPSPVRSGQRPIRADPEIPRQPARPRILTTTANAATDPSGTGEPAPIRIGVILGSERPHRGGEQVATWVRDVASRRGDAEFELVAPHDYSPPPPDVPLSSLASHDRHDHATEWAARIASLDGFVIVASDRDHGISRMFEGALQRLYAEWNNKAVGFVSYGVVGGQAVERLRLIAGELMMADVRERLVLSPMADSGPSAVFEAGDEDLAALHTMLDQVVSWSAALAPLRSVAAA